MAHYEMLRDYRFQQDVDDIRGADIYGAEQTRLGKVKDVIFDHDSGGIRYLVADLGHDRRVLIPADHLFRAVADENAFETDLPRERAANLPAFDEKMLQSEKDWQKHQEEQLKHWHRRESDEEETLEKEYLEKEYEDRWHAGPVQHRRGSDRDITPDEEPELPSAEPAERIVTGADLTPHRIAGKFPGDSGPMVVPGSPNTTETTLRPAGTVERAEDEAWGNLLPSERFRGFQENLRRRAPELRQQCPICCRGTQKVA